MLSEPKIVAKRVPRSRRVGCILLSLAGGLGALLSLASPDPAGGRGCSWSVDHDGVFASLGSLVSVAVRADAQTALVITGGAQGYSVVEVDLRNGGQTGTTLHGPETPREWLDAGDAWLSVSGGSGQCVVTRWSRALESLNRIVAAEEAEGCLIDRVTPSAAAIVYWSTQHGLRRYGAVALSLATGEATSRLTLPPGAASASVGVVEGHLLATWCGAGMVYCLDEVDAVPTAVTRRAEPCMTRILGDSGGGGALALFGPGIVQRTLVVELSRMDGALSARTLDELAVGYGAFSWPDSSGAVADGWLVDEGDGSVLHLRREPMLGRAVGRSALEVAVVASSLDPIRRGLVQLSVVPQGTAAVQMWGMPDSGRVQFRRLLCR